jgi:hypothetical protein
VTIGIGQAPGPDGEALALGDPGPVDRLVDRALPEVPGGVDQGVGHGRAVERAVHLDHALVTALKTELVDLVVEDQLVAKEAGGELEVLRLALGVGPVPR